MDKLKPCPFCGGEAIMEAYKFGREHDARYRVKCSNKLCFCETNWADFSEEDAAERWNRRVNNGT